MSRTKIVVSPWAVMVAAVFFAFSQGEVFLAVSLAAALHELGHYGAIRLCRGRVSAMHLSVFGAEMKLRGRFRYPQEMVVTAAGAAANLLFALLFAGMGKRWEFFYLLSGAQAILGAFNLLPVRPLDGGQLLWLVVAWFTEPYTADRVCFGVSLAVSVAFTVFAALLLQRTGEGMFLLFGALVLSYHAMGEKGLVKPQKKR